MQPDLAKLTPQAVLAAMTEFHRLGRQAFLLKYGFAASRTYRVRDPSTGALCDSKAIVGAAFAHLGPNAKPLEPREFSGGVQTVVRALQRLGFQVTAAAHELPSTATIARSVSTPWTSLELELVVADYLDMLVLHLNGQPFSKAERRRRLVPLLNQRSEAAIEFKRRNISAVLEWLGVPPLQGYLPAANVQRDLVEEVERQVAAHATVDASALSAVERPSEVPDIFDFANVVGNPPKREHRISERANPYLARGIKRDYFEREANNRRMGLAGEEFIVRFERWRLARHGLDRLAEKVCHVALTEGDGLGYDVLSFWPDGRERYVEVKTTAFGQTTPFFISSNEERFSREHAESFTLCRVYDFRDAPKLFELPGEVTRHCTLDPVTYRASFA